VNFFISRSLLVAVLLFSTCALANHDMWEAVKQNDWARAIEIYDAGGADLSYAPAGEKSVLWYIQRAGREDIYDREKRGLELNRHSDRVVRSPRPVSHRASLQEMVKNDADECSLMVKTKVRFMSQGLVSADQGEYVVPVSPTSGALLKISRLKTGEQGSLPKDVLCLTPRAQDLVAEMVSQYPKEMCSLLRANKLIPVVLKMLFRSEHSNPGKRKVFLREDETPSMLLCKSLLESKAVVEFRRTLSKAMKRAKPEACFGYCLTCVYPSEVAIILKALKSVVLDDNVPCKSFLSLRVIAPLLMALRQEEKKDCARTLQVMGNDERVNQLDEIVTRIIALPFENLEPCIAPLSPRSSDMPDVSGLIARLKMLIEDD
jgi:hypothetical protein